MSLASFVPLRDSVEIVGEGGAQSLTLYGLEGLHLALLVQEHREALAAVYASVIAGEVTAQSVPQVLETLLDEAPRLVAAVIAFGCREPDAMLQAAALPIGTQIEAVEKIVRLTLAGDPGGKKALAIVNRLAEATLLSLRSASTNGSANSGDMSAS